MKKTLTLFSLLALAGMLCGQTITVTSPVGGEHWLSGSHHNITWIYGGLPDTNMVKLLLYCNGTLLGSIAENVAIGSNGSGTYDWTVGKLGSTAVDGYKVRIRRMASAQPYGESPQAFSITRIVHQAMIAKKMTPTPAIHSHGSVTVHINLVCDLDEGQEISTPGCDDFWWMQNSNPPHQRLFIPCNGALFKTLGVGADSSWAVLHGVNFPTQQNPIPDANLPDGMIVAYRTHPYLRWGFFRVVGKGSDNCLAIEWTTYE